MSERKCSEKYNKKLLDLNIRHPYSWTDSKLIETLPANVLVKEDGTLEPYGLRILKLEELYEVEYLADHIGYSLFFQRSKVLADALAMAFIYLLEKGFVNAVEINERMNK